MAVTPVGNPYVESSDLVANYPGASEALAERIDIVGVNPFANAAARDAAIPSPVQGQMCSLNDDNKGYRYDGSAWILFSGAGAANFTNTATGTYTTGEIQYKFLTFTGSDDLIVDQAGFADILVIGGGAGGSSDGTRRSGGGSGLLISNVKQYLDAGTITITVGAGGAGGSPIASQGATSSIGSLVLGYGGSPGGSTTSMLFQGRGPSGPSGGVSGTTFTVQAGGGGMGGNGTEWTGGPGLANSLTGSPITYCRGGVFNGGAGAANTGDGGGGSGSGTAGGSGLVIVRVVV